MKLHISAACSALGFLTLCTLGLRMCYTHTLRVLIVIMQTALKENNKLACRAGKPMHLVLENIIVQSIVAGVHKLHCVVVQC